MNSKTEKNNKKKVHPTVEEQKKPNYNLHTKTHIPVNDEIIDQFGDILEIDHKVLPIAKKNSMDYIIKILFVLLIIGIILHFCLSI